MILHNLLLKKEEDIYNIFVNNYQNLNIFSIHKKREYF